MKPVLLILLGSLFLLWLTTNASAVCSTLGDCSCTWTTSGATQYHLPNDTNQSFTCAIQCTDSDGSCLTMGTTCYITIRESFSAGVPTVLDTGPLDGTAIQAAFCGGQTCQSPTIRAYTYTFTRNISVVRTNTTGPYFRLRCQSELPGLAAAGAWRNIYTTSPGNPNVSVSWFDETTNQGGVNESARIGGNRTCWNITPTTDGKIVNVSLWANFSTNGTNSTTFRLIDTEQWTNLSNTTMTFCRNITNALDGAMSWNNVSWAVCANSNTTTGAVTRYGMSCKSLRGPTWITSGTSMSTANSVGTFNWFNLTWPNAAAGSPCDPPAINNDWTIEPNLNCVYTAQTLNIGTGTIYIGTTAGTVTFQTGTTVKATNLKYLLTNNLRTITFRGGTRLHIGGTGT